MRNNKKAISPVITTISLILLALVLASIIFLWAKGFIGEQVSKFDRPISESCGNVVLKAAASGEGIKITNNGNVAVFKVGVRLTASDGSSSINDELINLVPGASLTIFPSIPEGSKVDLIPILLGKTSKGGSSEFTCLDNAFDVE